MHLKQYLKAVPLFDELGISEITVLLESSHAKKFPKNSVIINDGDITDSLYIIVSGSVKIFLTDDNGKEVILNVQSEGEFLGELALLDNQPRSASVKTLEPCEFIVISKQSFDQCLLSNPAMALKMMSTLTKRVRVLTDKVKNLALMGVYGRVVNALNHAARLHEGILQTDRKMPHHDIASMVGSSREMVSRVMKELADNGYIETRSGRVVLLKELPEIS